MHIYIKNETKIIIKKKLVQTDDGVQWWQQCARSFITPHEAPEPSKIFKRLQPFTCEWLARPDVALPEYSDTITSNLRRSWRTLPRLRMKRKKQTIRRTRRRSPRKTKNKRLSDFTKKKKTKHKIVKTFC